MRNPIEQYIHDRDEQVKKNLEDRDLRVHTSRFTEELVRTNYTKNFTWMGIPILQYPSDLMVMQEIIWKIRPQMIIELGVAFGGMTGFYATIMNTYDDQGGTIYAVDKEIRPYARNYLNSLPKWIQILETSSTDENTVAYISERLCPHGNLSFNTLVSLDSNHTADHVLKELRLYAPLVSVGSYLVVFDTAIEFFGHLDKNQDRPWSKGNNPYTAVMEFMKNNDEFIIDKEVEARALITAAPDGWLKRIK